MATTMRLSERNLKGGSRSVFHSRRFLICRECGWVPYVMTPEEKATNDRRLEQYQLSTTERHLCESAFRQCLRCEAPASAFAVALERDLARVVGHIVTLVFVGGEWVPTRTEHWSTAGAGLNKIAVSVSLMTVRVTQGGSIWLNQNGLKS